MNDSVNNSTNNSTNNSINNLVELINILLNDRNKIVEELSKDYSYDNLLKLFGEINKEKDGTIKIKPNDRYVYRILTGQMNDHQYNKSSIDWIPSEELIDGIISLAKFFDIQHVEEIYSGIGILSALFAKKEKTINITTSDTFENIQTCNKLDIVPIAKRGIEDYKYYKQLNEPYPQMIISTYYPEINIDGLVEKKNDLFVKELMGLIQSNNHKIIIIITPLFFTNFYNIFYHVLLNSNYTLHTYHIKAIDKYFYISDIFKKQYKSTMIAHIFIKNELLNNNKSIDKIMESAIFPIKYIDTNCKFIKWITILYPKISAKLTKNIYHKYDFMKPLSENKEVYKLLEHYNMIINTNLKNIPQYIFEIDEFIFWVKCIINDLYFVFNNRNQFYAFYTQAISMENSEIRRNIGFPEWITISDKPFKDQNNPKLISQNIYKYLYLDLICNTNNWKNNQKIFDFTFKKYNNKNKNILFNIT